MKPSIDGAAALDQFLFFGLFWLKRNLGHEWPNPHAIAGGNDTAFLGDQALEQAANSTTVLPSRIGLDNAIETMDVQYPARQADGRINAGHCSGFFPGALFLHNGAFARQSTLGRARVHRRRSLLRQNHAPENRASIGWAAAAWSDFSAARRVSCSWPSGCLVSSVVITLRVMFRRRRILGQLPRRANVLLR